MGQPLSERIGQSIVTEDRPGAGGSLAAEIVVRAQPDGYMLLMATVANAINATLYPDLKFSFVQDIAPVACIGVGEYVMVVTPSFPARQSPSSSPMPRPIRARSTWRPRATGPQSMCSANCSR